MYEATIEDPKVFTRPWKMRMPLYRRFEPGKRILEYKCVEFVEQLMYGHLGVVDPATGQREQVTEQVTMGYRYPDGRGAALRGRRTIVALRPRSD